MLRGTQAQTAAGTSSEFLARASRPSPLRRASPDRAGAQGADRLAPLHMDSSPHFGRGRPIGTGGRRSKATAGMETWSGETRARPAGRATGLPGFLAYARAHIGR